MVQVIVTPQAQKDYQKFQLRDQKKIRKRLEYLQQDQYIGKKLTGKYQESFSLRAWPFRIFYLIHNNKAYITHIEHRQGAYKKR